MDANDYLAMLDRAKEQLPETDARGAFRQRLLTDQRCTQARHAALRQLRITLKDITAADQLQHGVPQKLQPFVTGDLVDLPLMRIGRMRQCFR